MELLSTKLQDAKLIKPRVFADERGYFLETWSQQTYAELLNQGNPLNFVQDNYSSSKQHILRGLHLQFQHPQGKLVRVTRGEVFDVIVDLRPSSATFGQWEGFTLSEENHHILWVPPGFAHGFYTITERADLSYKCTEYYRAQDEGILRWDDPTLNIQWPLLFATPPALSHKDSCGASFAEVTRMNN